jgi:hypothetical protein
MSGLTIAGTPVNSPCANPNQESKSSMNHLPLPAWFSCLLMALFITSGCSEEKYTGPESFGPDEVNPAMNEAFADASDAVKKMVQDALLAYSKQDFKGSSSIINAICNLPDLSDPQRQTASRCLLTVNDELVKAAESGDKDAQRFMQRRSAMK